MSNGDGGGDLGTAAAGEGEDDGLGVAAEALRRGGRGGGAVDGALFLCLCACVCNAVPGDDIVSGGRLYLSCSSGHQVVLP